MDLVDTSGPQPDGRLKARQPLQPQPQHPPWELLRRMIEEISAELELEPLLTRLVEYACLLAGADDGTVGLYDPDRGVVRTAAVWRMPERELGAEMGRGQGLAGQVLASGRPVVARYGDLPGINLGELADNRVIGVPIRWKGELVGVFGIGAAPPQQLGEEHVELLGMFARHAAIAIDNARSYQQACRRTARFELIVRVARIITAAPDLPSLLQQAADAIHEVLEYPSVDIPLLDPEQPDTLVVGVRGGLYKQLIRGEDRLPVHGCVMGDAVLQRRAQRVDDVSRDPRYVRPPARTRMRAELAVPILLGERVLGVVNVEGPAPFDELDQATLEAVADHLALAIENARLVEAAREAALAEQRRRLAHDLHDAVTQTLSGIQMLAGTLPAAWQQGQDEGLRRSARVAELARTAVAEMRQLLLQLQPAAGARSLPAPAQHGAAHGVEWLSAGGLGAALPRLLEAMAAGHLEVHCDVGRYRPQSLELEEALYRVCQEAVSNVLRHAQATRLDVVAAVEGAQAVLRIRDDGRGLPASSPGSGLGLGSMSGRITALGGRFALQCAQGGGVAIEAVVPRRDRSAP